ncbi:hypothetical protein MASR2M44_21380 [Bacteroidota bacterium]
MSNPNNTYRERLIQAVNGLKEIQIEAFGHLVSVAMEGEFSDLNERFEIGEEVKFDLEMFADCKDQNVKILYDAVVELSLAYEKIMNINGIKESELEEY